MKKTILLMLCLVLPVSYLFAISYESSLDATKVLKTGDTMTGGLTVQSNIRVEENLNLYGTNKIIFNGDLGEIKLWSDLPAVWKGFYIENTDGDLILNTGVLKVGAGTYPAVPDPNIDIRSNGNITASDGSLELMNDTSVTGFLKSSGFMKSDTFIQASTMTVTGNAFSIGGSTFVVKDGIVSIGGTQIYKTVIGTTTVATNGTVNVIPQGITSIITGGISITSLSVGISSGVYTVYITSFAITNYDATNSRQFNWQVFGQ